MARDPPRHRGAVTRVSSGFRVAGEPGRGCHGRASPRLRGELKDDIEVGLLDGASRALAGRAVHRGALRRGAEWRGRRCPSLSSIERRAGYEDGVAAGQAGPATGVAAFATEPAVAVARRTIVPSPWLAPRAGNPT